MQRGTKYGKLISGPAVFNQCTTAHWCARNGPQVYQGSLGEGYGRCERLTNHVVCLVNCQKTGACPEKFSSLSESVLKIADLEKCSSQCVCVCKCTCMWIFLLSLSLFLFAF